jgi:hypothetical protein
MSFKSRVLQACSRSIVIFLPVVVVLLLIVLLPSPSPAAGVEKPSACHTPGYSDFLEIVVYFTEDANGLHNKVSPDAFSDENIARLIRDSISRSFADCLNDADGKEKVITVLSPSAKERKFFYQNSYKLTEKDNLVVAVKKTYIPSEQNQSGLGGYGLITYDVYRPNSGATCLDSRASRIGVFFDKGEISFQSQMEGFFSTFGPVMVKGHAPWGKQ